MLEFLHSWRVMMETGHWSVFLYYAVAMLVLIVPRMVLGWTFYGLRRWGLIQDYPRQRFSAMAFVTVAGEAPDALERCLRGLKRSLVRGTTDHSLLVIIDKWGDPRLAGSNLELARISRNYADMVLCTDARSKRRNLRELMRAARARGLLRPITVLVDSDTFVADENVLEKLLRPFSDKRIGGVTTAQLVHDPRTWVQKVSFWLEHARMVSSMAAASLFEQVLCLPGRMYAVRTELIEDKMDALVRDSFRFLWWGPWQCFAGDDRFITNCVLKAGYGTIMVPDAIVTTLAPETFEQTRRMWTRWGRSSQAYTLRSPWLLRPRNWIAAYITWGDIAITVSTVAMIAVYWPYSILTGTRIDPWYEMAAYSLIGMMLTIVSRQFVHLYRFPRSWLSVPAFVFMVTAGQFFRFWALITPHKIGVWGTRDVDQAGTKGAWELDESALRDVTLEQSEQGSD